jgi:CubicO group peptidase (beta-lactamase class C family)
MSAPNPILISAIATFITSAAIAFDHRKLEEIDEAIGEAIDEELTPGAVFWLEQRGQTYANVYGHMSLEPERIPARIDAIYDSASLTKVVATTPAIMLLVEQGVMEIDALVSAYLDDFESGGKETITIRHLMTHTSGLKPGIPLTIEKNGVSKDWAGYEMAIALAKSEEVQHPPGTGFIYSDINFILLGEIIQQVTGQLLEDFTRESVFQPLGMKDTGYLPSPKLRYRTAPTKWLDGKMQRGTPNNPICRRTGGVHGHAGMFTTAADLARFCRMILNNGELDGVRFLHTETIRLMTSVQSPSAVKSLRGLGWDIDSSYSSQRGTIFPVGGFGHTGFTGPSIWIDPASETFVIFMSNRIHPNGKGNVVPLRKRLGTLAAEALGYPSL